MGRHKKVPKRRFAGFAGEWEERKFEDLLNQHDGIRRGPFGSALKKEFFVKESDYVVYEQHNAIYDNYETRYNITKEKFEELRKFQLNEGDFILSGAGTIGKISRVPKGIKPGVFNQALVRIKIDTNVMDSEYFLQWIRSDDMQRKLTDSNPGSAMVNLVPMSEVKNWDVLIPSIPEQQKIGDFFKNLDEMISLQQRKLEKTKSLKSAYLAEMFPAEGERVPKRRFAGFTGEWKQGKLGEIVDITMGQSPSGKNYTDNPNDHILVQGNGDIKNGWVSPRVWTTQITKMAKKGDIILSVRAPVGDVGKTKYDVVLGRGVAGIQGNEFIFQYLSKMKSNGYWKRFSTGSTFESINSNDLKDAIIMIPGEEEQQKIGKFFKQLDDKISIEQRKLDKLKALKQAYLHEMFV